MNTIYIRDKLRIRTGGLIGIEVDLLDESWIILCQLLVYSDIKRILHLLLMMVSAEGEKLMITVFRQSMVMHSFIYECNDLVVMCILQDLSVLFDSYKTI